MKPLGKAKSCLRAAVSATALGLVAMGVLVPVTATTAGATPPTPGALFGGLSASDGYTTTANLSPGSITHVWLIILENKSYNSEFSGVNDDTFLWETLPSEGALLQNYYGTGHTSMDNYITLVSGQAPSYDVQSDCSDANTQFASNSGVAASTTAAGLYNGGLDGIVDSTAANPPNVGGATGNAVGGDTQNWFYGQAVSGLGPNSPIGSTKTTNGCTYPTNVATLFDQFNLAGITWKGYAQDLGGAQQLGSSSFQANTVPGRDSGPCGAPGNPNGAAENPVSNPTFLSGAEGYPVASDAVSSTVAASSDQDLTATATVFSASDVGDEVIITSGTAINEYGTVASQGGNWVHLSGAGFSTVPGGSQSAPPAGSSFIVGLADTSSYTAASLVAGSGTGPDGQAYSANNPEYSDQYVAKHFPPAWFESLSGDAVSGTPLTSPANGGTNCDANHIANLDSPVNGLVHDLVDNTVPNFSWITPDNCSDGHDASCKGNNLSGAFGTNTDGTINLNDPIYSPSTTAGANCTPNCSGIPSYDPEATTPRNYAGGTYAADLFLAYYVPLIERSTAFQTGLIDITFDEGEPSFPYGSNSFNNIGTTGPTSVSTGNCSTTTPPGGQYNSLGGCFPTSSTGTEPPSGTGFEDGGTYGTAGNTPSSYPSSSALSQDEPTGNLAPNDQLTYGPGGQYPGADSQFGADDLFADSAGESILTGGSPVAQTSEPNGPNSPLIADSNGYQLFYGPGFNLDIDRPLACPAGYSESDGANTPVSSTATATGTTTTLTDSTQAWTTNQWAGWKLSITGGTGAGESSLISKNTATVLTFGAVATAPDSTSTYTISGNCIAGEVIGDGGTTSLSTRTDSSGVSNSGATVTDNAIVADDTGREIVTAKVGGTSVSVGTAAYNSHFDVAGNPLPAGDAVYVGEVTQTGPGSNGPNSVTSSAGSGLAGATSGTSADGGTGSFQLVDDNGNAVTPTAAVSSVTLSGECDLAVTSPTAGTNLPSTCTANLTPDPLFDAIDPTTGGGDTGSVLISPYITPGTVSTVDYNHYSWLRTMEDIFDVSSCQSTDDIALTAGSVCGGLDQLGHLGYAAQTNLVDFGSDVFTAPTGDGFQPLSPPIDLPESPLMIALPLLGIVLLGGYLALRRRRSPEAAVS